jgi:hypothetical protein
VAMGGLRAEMCRTTLRRLIMRKYTVVLTHNACLKHRIPHHPEQVRQQTYCSLSLPPATPFSYAISQRDSRACWR